jgi:DNA-binding response OmpR family regulator
MRVLVVDDDRALGLFLQKGLKSEGHDVEWVGDGDAALERATVFEPDLMVLDLGLPKRDGIQVLEAMRGKFEKTSVLVLTGRSQVEERVRCLNLGADDCLMKPFSFHELSARCRAILRRKVRFEDPVLRFGGIEMDRMDRKVSRGGKAIVLTAKEFALLEFLLQRQGECCARAELLTQVWGMAPDAETNVVDVYVNYLRRKLNIRPGTVATKSSVIETVRGRGYRLRAATAATADKKAAQPEPVGHRL